MSDESTEVQPTETDVAANNAVETQSAVATSDANGGEVTPTPAEPNTVSQEEYNKLFFQFKQAERDKEAALKQTQPITETQTEVSKAPTLEDFDYDDEKFNAASIQYQVKQQVDAALKTQASTQEQTNATNAQEEVTTNFNNRAVEYASTNPDYEKAITASNGLAFAPHIQEVLLSSEVGPQLDHMLLTDPTLVQKLHNMSPTQAIMEMGRLESKVSAKSTTPTNISNAPTPIEPVGGATRASGDYRYDDSLSYDEYEEKAMQK